MFLHCPFSSGFFILDNSPRPHELKLDFNTDASLLEVGVVLRRGSFNLDMECLFLDSNFDIKLKYYLKVLIMYYLFC